MIGRIASPALGFVAVAFVLLMAVGSIGGTLAGTMLLVLIAGAGLAYARFRARAGVSPRQSLVERVGGCGLGPGVSIHAVRVEDRLLVVGVSGSAIALLDTAPYETSTVVEDIEAHRSEPSPASVVSPVVAALRGFGLSVALTACVAGTAGSATAAQSDSTRQSADLSPSSRVDTRKSAAPAVAPPLALPPSPPVELPSAGETPLGPMLWLAALALLPFALMGLTSFVKISVVLSLLRSALGTPQVPSDPLLAGIALALTSFVMAPVGSEMWARIEASNADLATASGVLAAASAAAPPLRGFLERNARPDEVALFVTLSTRDGRPAADPGSFGILVPAFVTSELREAFVAGFFLFIPFLVVDLVVSNILMSMGMVMVSPTTVSLPFKILLFVLVDGWPLLAKALALSYQ